MKKISLVFLTASFLTGIKADRAKSLVDIRTSGQILSSSLARQSEHQFLTA